MQARAKMYLVHEHPANATSWDMAKVKKVCDMEGVFKIKFDMCRFGMAALDPDDGELEPVQKRTAILTNDYGVANRMRRDCPNRSGDECTHHTHLNLEGGIRC